MSKETEERMRLLETALSAALEALDGIATEPADLNDGYDHYKAARYVAKFTAQHIRKGLGTLNGKINVHV